MNNKHMEPIGNKLISVPALNRNKIIIKYRSNFITYDPTATYMIKKEKKYYSRTKNH